MTINVIHLSRRNLQTLLNKLDRNANAGYSVSECTLIKQEEAGLYPTDHRTIVVAVEDDEYYFAREAGPVHPLDEPK